MQSQFLGEKSGFSNTWQHTPQKNPKNEWKWRIFRKLFKSFQDFWQTLQSKNSCCPQGVMVFFWNDPLCWKIDLLFVYVFRLLYAHALKSRRFIGGKTLSKLAGGTLFSNDISKSIAQMFLKFTYDISRYNSEIILKFLWKSYSRNSEIIKSMLSPS